MVECKIQGSLVNYEEVCAHWTVWNKIVKDPLNYNLSISLDLVEAAFDSYWEDTIERESDPELDDGFEITGVDLKLKNAKYPSLNEILISHAELFCEFILEYLQVEFIEFVMDRVNLDSSVKSYTYRLISINAMKIIDGHLYLSGNAMKNKYCNVDV